MNAPRRPPAESVRGALLDGVKDTFTPVLDFLNAVGGHLILFGRAMSWAPRRPYRGTSYVEACEFVGVGSLPIVILVGLFTGMVFALQTVNAFKLFGLEGVAGGVTGKALALELSPVLTSLMLAGRAGAGIATELGTMRITEQIDALESMAVNPIQFLVLPRVVAGMIMAPLLTLLFFIVGMFGAYIISVINLGVDHGHFVYNTKNILQVTDVMQGVLKSVVFGLAITLIGCYQGYNATGGGRGVGMGTTRAVVIGSVSVLVLDYFLSEILLALIPPQQGTGL